MKRSRDTPNIAKASPNVIASYDDDSALPTTLSRSSRGRLRKTRNFIASELDDEDETSSAQSEDLSDDNRFSGEAGGGSELSHSEGEDEEGISPQDSLAQSSGIGHTTSSDGGLRVPTARARSAPLDTTATPSSRGNGPPAKPTGRPVSFIWPIFTSEYMPWKLKKGPCNFCKDIVLYHKKSEYVLSHLKKCQPFLKHCQE
jgi:hypothetical protein